MILSDGWFSGNITMLEALNVDIAAWNFFRSPKIGINSFNSSSFKDFKILMSSILCSKIYKIWSIKINDKS